MGTLLSLSRSATVVGWNVSIACTIVFGSLFLFGWLSEECARSEKWKKRRRLFLTLAIVGVIGEQTFTILEFAFSEHLETIDEATIAHLEGDAVKMLVALSPCHLNQNDMGANKRLLDSLKKPEFAGMPVFIQAVDDHEAKELALEIGTLVRNLGMKPEFVTQKRTGVPDLWISNGVTIFTHRSKHPEQAPYSLGAVPHLPTATPEERAWLAARLLTRAFLLWGVATMPDDVPSSPRFPHDPLINRLTFFPARDAIVIEVGFRPTVELWRMLVTERHLGWDTPSHTAPTVLVNKP